MKKCDMAKQVKSPTQAKTGEWFQKNVLASTSVVSVWGEGRPGASENEFRMLFENSDTAKLFWDGNLFVDCNEAALRMAGYSRKEELVGRHPGDLSPEFQPDGRSSREKAQEMYDRAVEKGTHSFEWVHTKADGEKFWVDVVLTALPIGGRLLFHVVWFDITERKRAEAEREEARKFLDSIVENIPDMIFVKNAEDLRFVRTNRAGEELIGFSRETLIGKRNQDIFPKHHAEFYDATDKEVLTTGELLDIPEEIFRTSQKGVRILHTKKLPIRGPGGESQYILRISKDITDRKRSEEQLRLQAAAIEQVAEAIIITDPKGAIRYVNPAFEKITGFTGAEALGKNPRFMTSGKQDDDFYRKMWSTLSSKLSWSGRLINLKKGGEEITLDVNISPIVDTEGELSGYVSVERDVTEQIKTEARLAQTQKMETLGALAGGIAHDFNNILTPIIGYSWLLMDGVEGPINEEQHNDLEKVITAAERAQDMVGQILLFARGGEHEKYPVQIGPIAKEALKLIRATLPVTIEIKTDIRADRDVVEADPTQIHQILMNLCTNAYHAIENGMGSIDVVVENTYVDGDLSAQRPELNTGNYLRLTVTDTGCGMSPEVKARIFDPFFTTKKAGEGTGMGLSVVHGIVRNCGGSIFVYSEEGQGTTFHVYLPITSQEIAEVAALEPIPHGDEQILLVDDERDIAELGKKVLEGLGYNVEIALGGQEALDKFRAEPQVYDVIVTDLTMPKVTGLALIREAKKIRPDVATVLCTGFVGGILQEQSMATGISELVMKPFTARVLGEAVRRVVLRQQNI